MVGLDESLSSPLYVWGQLHTRNTPKCVARFSFVSPPEITK